MYTHILTRTNETVQTVGECEKVREAEKERMENTEKSLPSYFLLFLLLFLLTFSRVMIRRVATSIVNV